MKVGSTTVALLVRIPAPLHQRAKLAAVRQRISVARLVTAALTAHLRKPTKARSPK